MRRLSRRNKKITRTQSFVQTERGLVSFELVRSSARRSLTLSVNEKAQIQLAVPLACSQEAIVGFINQKSSWLFKKIAQAKHHHELMSAKRFDDGHEFYFLGKTVRLSVNVENIKRARIKFDGTSWTLSLPEHLDQNKKERVIRAKLMAWYRQQAEEILGGRIFHHARRMGLQPARVAIRSFKRLWGNCDFRTRSVQLNWQIIHSPMEVIDYVIVHELCHLVHPNHSKRFWSEVEEHMPGFREPQRWLKEHALGALLP